MDQYHTVTTKMLEDTTSSTQKSVDDITAMRVSCADMELTLAQLYKPFSTKRIHDLTMKIYSESLQTDKDLMEDVKEEPQSCDPGANTNGDLPPNFCESNSCQADAKGVECTGQGP